MNNNLVDITLVIDNSGSMEKLTNDTIGGVNRLIADQKAQPGDANISIILFNNHSHVLCNGVNIDTAPTLSHRNYRAGGGTALLNAVGAAINNAGARLRDIPEANRPGKVVFVIVTDGEENSSRQYSKEQIKQLVSEQTNKYNWEFVYLGANVDAFHEAASIGFAFANTSNYGANTKGIESVYSIASHNLGELRSRTSQGLTATMAFDSDEIATLNATVDNN